MAEPANYHILLWPEPLGPSTYLCLLCSVQDCTLAEILTHVTDVHSVTPVPTPLAAQPFVLPSMQDGDAARGQAIRPSPAP
jgi:hypothetical protein